MKLLICNTPVHLAIVRHLNLNIMKYSVCYILLLSIFLFSCQEDRDAAPNEGQAMIERRANLVSAYQNFASQDTDGEVSIQSYKTLASSQEQGGTSYKVSAVFSDDQNNPRNLGVLEVNDMSISYRDKYGYSSQDAEIQNLYGRQIVASIKNTGSTDPALRGQRVIEDSIYMPLELNISHPKSTNNILANSDAYVKWNADSKNQLGVLIVINYEPEDTSNNVRRFLVSDDIGTYGFSRSDFEDIPNGANISVDVIRGDFNLIEDVSNNDLYSLYGFTIVSIPYTVSFLD